MLTNALFFFWAKVVLPSRSYMQTATPLEDLLARFMIMC